MIDIDKYCTRSGYLMKRTGTPFSKGDYTYATDGHVLIRIPRVESVPEREDAPEAEKLHHQMVVDEKSIGTQLSNLVNLTPRDKCTSCDGARFRMACFRMACSSCDGEGGVECSECGHIENCEDCHETGWVSVEESDARAHRCDDCLGSGLVSSDKALRFNHDIGGCVGFATRYLYQISSLPNVKLYIGHRTQMSPHYFSFDGGDGLLMPYRLSGEEKDYTNNEDS